MSLDTLLLFWNFTKIWKELMLELMEILCRMPHAESGFCFSVQEVNIAAMATGKRVYTYHLIPPRLEKILVFERESDLYVAKLRRRSIRAVRK